MDLSCVCPSQMIIIICPSILLCISINDCSLSNRHLNAWGPPAVLSLVLKTKSRQALHVLDNCLIFTSSNSQLPSLDLNVQGCVYPHFTTTLISLCVMCLVIWVSFVSQLCTFATFSVFTSWNIWMRIHCSLQKVLLHVYISHRTSLRFHSAKRPHVKTWAWWHCLGDPRDLSIVSQSKRKSSAENILPESLCCWI